MNQEEKYIGYLKYSGKSIEDGLLDARKSAEALLGFDEILRYFITKDIPDLKDIDFEIPVRIRKGCWEVLITTVTIIFICSYVKETAKVAAKKGLFETGAAKDIEKIFRYIVKKITEVVKIASHLGTLKKKEIHNALKNIEVCTGMAKIPNKKGEYLSVKIEYLNLILECPEKLFSKNAKIIEKGIILEFGVFIDGQKEKVSVPFEKKTVFYSESEEEILFPELEHNQNVELKGKIMRGDEKANSLGFEYKGHILICRPIEKRSIATYKEKIVSQQEEHIFQKVKITGKINRLDRNGEFKKYPTIIFSNIIQVEKPPEQATLF